MGYYCNMCHMWVSDETTIHYCNWFWPTSNYHTCVCKDIKCMRIDCIYNYKFWSGSDDKEAICNNKNIMLNEFGICICYVRRNKPDTAKD